MAELITIYEAATGRPVYEGFGPDPRENEPGYGLIQTDIPSLEEAGGLPVCGIERVWVVEGQRVERDGLTLSRISREGLTATLEEGHFFGEIHVAVEEADSYTFSVPASNTALALDVALDPQGSVQLQPYQWDPQAEPPETKGALPLGWTLVEADVLRGVLPAGAGSLDELGKEE